MPASRRLPLRARPADSPESTEERVFRCATELFARRGFDGTGIRDIASAVGLKTATLYHYMTNKDDLLLEIMVGAISPLTRAAARISLDVVDPAARLARIAEQHVWAHATDRLRSLVADTEVRALSGPPLETVMALRHAYEGVWRAAVRDGVAAGLFEAPNIDLATRALLQMTTGVAQWFSPGGPISLTTICADYADWSLGVLRAQRDGAPIRRSQLDLPPPNLYLATPAPAGWA